MFNILKNMKKINHNTMVKRFNIKDSKKFFKTNFSSNEIIKVKEEKLFLKNTNDEKKNNSEDLMMRASMII